MNQTARVRMNPRQRVRLTQEVRLAQMVARRVQKILNEEDETIGVRIVGVQKQDTLFSDMHFCLSDASTIVEMDPNRANCFTASIMYFKHKGFRPYGALADSLAEEIIDKIGVLLEEADKD